LIQTLQNAPTSPSSTLQIGLIRLLTIGTDKQQGAISGTMRDLSI